MNSKPPNELILKPSRIRTAPNLGYTYTGRILVPWRSGEGSGVETFDESATVIPDFNLVYTDEVNRETDVNWLIAKATITLSSPKVLDLFYEHLADRGNELGPYGTPEAGYLTNWLVFSTAQFKGPAGSIFNP